MSEHIKQFSKFIPLLIVVLAITIFFMALVSYAGISPLSDEAFHLRNDISGLSIEKEALENDLLELRSIASDPQKEKERYFENAMTIESQIKKGISPYKAAYLTFDDGPFNLTYEYLRVLKEHNTLATFFVLGKTDYLPVYEAIIKDGHTLGNHTYSHLIRKGLYYSPESFIKDVLKQDAFIKENFNYEMTVFRFPGGSSSSGKMKDKCINLLHENNYNYVDWNSLTRDAEIRGLTLEQAYNYVMPRALTKDFSVLLMHDFNSASLGALPTIIETLEENNYVILPLFKESLAVH